MIDVILSQRRAARSREIVVDQEETSKDKPIKSILKSISWRVVGTIDTMIISYIITGELAMAASIGGIEVFSKVLLYYLHERAWSRFSE